MGCCFSSESQETFSDLADQAGQVASQAAEMAKQHGFEGVAAGLAMVGAAAVFFGKGGDNPRKVPPSRPIDDGDDYEPPVKRPAAPEGPDAPQAGYYDEEGVYCDTDFPANVSSLGNVKGDDANPEEQARLMEQMQYVREGWARPCELWGPEATFSHVSGVKDMEGPPCLFRGTSPMDVKQGGLGDCWLVCAMAAIAEYPFMVRRLFRQQEYAPDGRYDIRLYDATKGEWVIMTIDDRIPFEKKPGYYGNMMMAKPTSDGEIWPCLLEKACAKLVGGYWRLDGGFAPVALEMLTGERSHVWSLDEDSGEHKPRRVHCEPNDKSWDMCPATVPLRAFDEPDNELNYYFCSDDTFRDGWSDEELFAKFREWDQMGCIMSCSSRCSREGVIAGHAYSILRCVECWSQGELFRLIQIRNPHAGNEWSGRFSDDDEASWSAYPECAQACGHSVGHVEDGLFWIDLDSFKQCYKSICVNFQLQCDVQGRPQARFDMGYEDSAMSEDALAVKGHSWPW